ncbi:HD domain-containing protein [Halocatena pleomorpha]|uniref:HD domain-containing protein n=1 Tax=Halocatena pleomorpha TaxID=1785090 RepID=A0A3P3RH34_9EURY|nr:HD domain-containing protein [Halocatena pleomorpha]RRJ32847.1 HD domain-containing protein [Halocatena pleomorpha]
MGVEIRENPVTDDDFEEMKQFVHDYLTASVEGEEDGGRMRWYPWHSAEYRFNHILNVVSIATHIAEKEGANADVVRVAALFHDIAKLEVDQDVHADAGARITREYLRSHCEYPISFVDEVCDSIKNHSYQGPLTDLPLEARCLIESDLLDKVGANGMTLILLRMGYEARTHTDAPEMINRIVERGENVVERIVSDTAESIAHQRLKRVRWFREWLISEIAQLEPNDSEAIE